MSIEDSENIKIEKENELKTIEDSKTIESNEAEEEESHQLYGYNDPEFWIFASLAICFIFFSNKKNFNLIIKSSGIFRWFMLWFNSGVLVDRSFRFRDQNEERNE